ncbi:DNA-binding response regulator [Salipaludibacillus neizhouensis]|uniref:DNA-binding response regulator n=1 Tax=Salipaludibacillus neizhouensis TaxID=885475 RepID=A0A3A9K350_9BACI|nr:response regulator transcription factor [Salipaludibacillus neizhouensis]RKL67107.1 DNA-binding response regulator [Salipaludibacillus neizhouensis]
MTTILVIEDEEAINHVLRVFLQREGWHVIQAFSGNEGIDAYYDHHPDLILLDVMLPDRDGWSVLHEVREESQCPILMLTALGDVQHRLTGLNSGADDYITKPFIADEVVARVHAVLRRVTTPSEERDNSTFTYGELTINESTRDVRIGGNIVAILPRDFKLLLYLARNPNQTLTREQLLENVWGQDYEGTDRAVDLSVKRIRQALKDWSDDEGELTTVRGMGYQFRVYTKK